VEARYNTIAWEGGGRGAYLYAEYYYLAIHLFGNQVSHAQPYEHYEKHTVTQHHTPKPRTTRVDPWKQMIMIQSIYLPSSHLLFINNPCFCFAMHCASGVEFNLKKEKWVNSTFQKLPAKTSG